MGYRNHLFGSQDRNKGFSWWRGTRRLFPQVGENGHRAGRKYSCKLHRECEREFFVGHPESGKDRVKIDFKDNKATISAGDGDLDAESTIETLNAEGVPNHFSINVFYLLDYLKDKDSIVSIAWTGGTSPLAFQSANNPRVLIMPMQSD
ncbi:hypothetical protein ES703_55641 [subsurface metagenome]